MLWSPPALEQLPFRHIFQAAQQEMKGIILINSLNRCLIYEQCIRNTQSGE